MGTPQLQGGRQGQAGRNEGAGKKGRSRSALGLVRLWPRGHRSRQRGQAGAGRTHHWLSRGRAGSILSPMKGPGSAMSVFTPLRLLEPCRRAALAFSSLQGEVRPYPSPSDGPARWTRVTAGSRDGQVGWAHGFPPQTEQAGRARAQSHRAESPHTAPSPAPSRDLGPLLPAESQDRQGWGSPMPALGSSQHLSPWKCFPGRFQKPSKVLLTPPGIWQLWHRVKQGAGRRSCPLLGEKNLNKKRRC